METAIEIVAEPPPKQDSGWIRFLRACLSGVAVCGVLVIVFGSVGVFSCGGGSRGATHSVKEEKATRLAEIEQSMKGE